MTFDTSSFQNTGSVHDLEIFVALYGTFLRPKFYLASPSAQTTSTTRIVDDQPEHTGIAINLSDLYGDADTLAQIEKNRSLVALLRSWMIDDPAEDDPDLDQQMRELEAGRHSTQPLFSWHNH
jgi:hypothetical protein